MNDDPILRIAEDGSSAHAELAKGILGLREIAARSEHVVELYRRVGALESGNAPKGSGLTLRERVYAVIHQNVPPAGCTHADDCDVATDAVLRIIGDAIMRGRW